MESSTKEALSKRLVQLRTERGWTQNDLVEKMYLSQRSISSVEKGNCTLSNLIQLAGGERFTFSAFSKYLVVIVY